MECLDEIFNLINVNLVFLVLVFKIVILFMFYLILDL